MWNNCSHVLPNFEYLCLNKFCNWGHVVFSNGSKDWNHNLASPSRVRQNLWTFTSSMKQWAFIQSLEHSKCASAFSSGFPENSGLKVDQFIFKCCCPAPSWFCCCWFCCWFCPCLWLGATAPSSASAILMLIYNLILICCILFLFHLSIPDVINFLLSNFNPSQMLEFDGSLFLFWEAMSLITRISFFFSQLVHTRLFSFTFKISIFSLVKNFLILGIPYSWFWNPGWAPMLCMAVLHVWVSLRVA